MSDTLGILFTLTTYDTWLRGDLRGWIDEGRLMPPDPLIENADRQRMKHPAFLFPPDQWLPVGAMIGGALRERLSLRLWALSVQSWHVHFLVAATAAPIEQIVKCAKDAVRWGLRHGRPIWTDGYDKRFCFDEESLRRRIEYVERHNVASGLPARPWAFLERPFVTRR